MSPQKSLWSGLNVLVLSPTPSHPRDFGNRRRVYEVCSRLKDKGSRIIFLHYPVETNWRKSIPYDEQLEMIGCWDEYYLIPTSRTIFQSPESTHHSRDEWWDDAISTHLSWIFSKHKIDVFIVNYTWLSKAFDFAPRYVKGILDTHDKFAGRKELLVANGIEPEFFYMLEDEEAEAIKRPDLVWAIKNQEEEYFLSIGAKSVLTLLHAERAMPIAPVIRESSIIRFGIIGARNNINKVNLVKFLRLAQSYIRATLLPCEIIVAGTVCGLIDEKFDASIKIIGRVDSIDNFYQMIDCVIVPMEFSTGLKIKVGEALSRGLPLISHSHAFEGYVSTHRFHTLSSFDEILNACNQIVDQPELLLAMYEASVESAALSAASVDRNLEMSIELLSSRKSFQVGACVFIDANALGERSIVLDHALEVAEYISHLLPVTICISVNSETNLHLPSIDRLSSYGRIVLLSPAKINLLSLPLFDYEFKTYAEIMGEGHHLYWFACCLEIVISDKIGLEAVYISLPILSTQYTNQEISSFCISLSQCFLRCNLLYFAHTRLVTNVGVLTNASNLRISSLRRGHLESFTKKLSRHDDYVAIFCDAYQSDIAMAIAHIVHLIGCFKTRPAIISYDTIKGAEDADELAWTDPLTSCGLPKVAVFISSIIDYSAYFEFLCRADVHCIMSPQLPSDSNTDQEELILPPSTMSDLFTVLLHYFESNCSLAEPVDSQNFDFAAKDAGWNVVWKEIVQMRESFV